MEGLEYKDFVAEIKEEDVQENGTFRGYASTFGGKPDLGGDVVLPGAFTDTLKNGGLMGFGVAMCWMHDTKQPLGAWSKLVEDKRGLAVEGMLAMKTQIGREAYEFMKMGAIKGLSIGYMVSKDGSEFDDKKRIRNLKKLDLYEISPVTLPMNPKATITAVKALENASTEREFEDALREAGVSKKDALWLVNIYKPILFKKKQSATLLDLHKALRDVERTMKLQELATAVKTVNSIFQ